MQRLFFSTFVFGALLLPFGVQAQSVQPDYQKMIEDQAFVAACVQGVYDQQQRGEEIPGGLLVALKACYIGTMLESAAQFDTEPAPLSITVPEIPDIFVSPQAKLRLQEAYGKITHNLTIEESQRVGTCIDGIMRGRDAQAAPSAQEQRAIAQCYRGTAFAPIADVYEQVALRVDCAYDGLGSARVWEIVKARGGSERENAIVEKCIIERSAVIAGTAAVINTVTALGVRNVGALAYFLATQPFLLLGLRRKKVAWGVVYNRLTHRPVDLSIVRIHASQKVLRTRVTDAQGRYVFLVEPHPYALSVTKPEYASADNVFVQAPQGIVNTDIPLDPLVKPNSLAALWWQRVRARGHHVVAYASPLAAALGSIIDPKPRMIAISGASIALSILIITKTRRPRPNTVGTVLDAQTKQPVGNAVVRLFSQPWNKLAESMLTNSRGQYAFLVGEGTYYVTVEKADYTHAKTPEQAVQPGTSGWVGMSVQLDRVHRTSGTKANPS